MTDRPIIFSGPMVRALLEGRKTQTRRVLNPQPDAGQFFGRMTYVEAQNLLICRNATGMRQDIRIPYAPGDRLYVREAFSYDRLDVDRDGTLPPWYWADGNPDWGDWTRPKPSIHMPRWASRLTLTVTEVRVQLLQEISEADAVAEGVEPLHTGFFPYGITTFMTTFIGDREVPAQCCRTARKSYEMLWNSLHGPDAWDANPWVGAVSFSVQKENIDATRRQN